MYYVYHSRGVPRSEGPPAGALAKKIKYVEGVFGSIYTSGYIYIYIYVYSSMYHVYHPRGVPRSEGSPNIRRQIMRSYIKLYETART